MSIFNEIQEGGLNDVLVKRLGMKVSTPAPAVAPEVFPVIVLENAPPEYAFLKGERLCAGWLPVSAVAAQFSGARIRNPANSNLLVVIERIDVTTTASAYLRIHRGVSTDLTTARNGVLLDTRVPSGGGVNQCEAMLSSETALGVPAASRIAYRFATAAANYAIPVILKPGDAAEVWTDAVNQTLNVSLIWRERRAQPNELV